MPRIITIDKTAIQELNKDNQPLAKFFTDQSRLTFAISDSPHYQMAESEYQKLNPAEQRLADDLHVRHVKLVGLGRFVDITIADSTAKYVEQCDPGAFNSVAPEHQDTVRMAWGGELLTFDPQLVAAYNRLTARLPKSTWLMRGVVPELATIPVSNGPTNYGAARRNLALQPLNITPDGAVLPTPGVRMFRNAQGKPGHYYVEATGVTIPVRPKDPDLPGVRNRWNYRREVGPKLEAPVEYGPSVTGEVAMQMGAMVVIQGINYGLSKINGPIQEKRFNEKWGPMEPEVNRRLDEDPQLGAMVYVYYSSYVAGEASGIDGGLKFEAIRVAYGFTPDDAQRAFESQDSSIGKAGPGNQIGDQIWHKPKQPLDVRRLPLPKGVTVAGLATFAPGKEKLVRVRFRTNVGGGFDDRMHSREELDVPKGMSPRFFYLWPPSVISYLDVKVKTQEISWGMSKDGDWSLAQTDPWHKYNASIPVVKLDSWINPSTWFSDGATAAMVWPADNATANLFDKTSETGDPNNFLAGQGYRLVRWVRPEFIRVLKAPID